MAAQVTGAFVAAATVYATYSDAIAAYERANDVSRTRNGTPPHPHATAGIFCTFPANLPGDGRGQVSNISCAVEELLGTGL